MTPSNNNEDNLTQKDSLSLTIEQSSCSIKKVFKLVNVINHSHTLDYLIVNNALPILTHHMKTSTTKSTHTSVLGLQQLCSGTAINKDNNI